MYTASDKSQAAAKRPHHSFTFQTVLNGCQFSSPFFALTQVTNKKLLTVHRPAYYKARKEKRHYAKKVQRERGGEGKGGKKNMAYRRPNIYLNGIDVRGW